MEETEKKEEAVEEKKPTQSELAEIIRKNTELIESLRDKKEVKPLKLPSLGKGKRKKGYVNYLYIHENGEIEPLKVPVDEMTSMIEGSPRLAIPEMILNYKSNPTIIQPAWSSKPFSVVDNYKEAVQQKYLSAGYKLLALRAEQGNVKGKKQISGTMIFFIIVAILVAGYFLLF